MTHLFSNMKRHLRRHILFLQRIRREGTNENSLLGIYRRGQKRRDDNWLLRSDEQDAYRSVNAGRDHKISPTFFRAL